MCRFILKCTIKDVLVTVECSINLQLGQLATRAQLGLSVKLQYIEQQNAFHSK